MICIRKRTEGSRTRAKRAGLVFGSEGVVPLSVAEMLTIYYYFFLTACYISIESEESHFKEFKCNR